MISDILSDAAAQIRDYQQRMPACYDALTERIDAVLAHMDALRIALDTLPDRPTVRSERPPAK